MIGKAGGRLPLTPQQGAWLRDVLGVDAGGGRVLLAQAEAEPEPEPAEAARTAEAEDQLRRIEENEADQRADREGRPRTPPDRAELDTTQRRLREATASRDPVERARAYAAGQHVLGRLDPRNPSAGPQFVPPGWVPGPAELDQVERGIADARAAPLYELDAETYRRLAEDPDQGGRLSNKGRAERDTALNAARDKQLRRPLQRDHRGGDFVDGAGQQWDVKSFRSGVRNGFSRIGSADKIDAELKLGENVLVNTTDMTEEDVAALREEGARRGWGARVQYNHSNELPASLLLGRPLGKPPF